MPHDLVIGDVYLPPMLVAATLALVATSYTVRLMSGRGLMDYFANPPLVFLSITVLYTLLLGSTLFPT